MMKLFDFNSKQKKYCIVKLDSYNFSVREYLDTPQERTMAGKISEVEFKPTECYFGSLEYALRKAFLLIGRDFIDKKEFICFNLSYDPLKSIFDLKPRDIDVNNLDEVKILVKLNLVLII